MKISKIVSYLVLVVGVVSGILLYTMSKGLNALVLENGAEEALDLPLKDTIPFVTPLYNVALIVIVILLVVTVISIINGLIKNPSSLKKTLVGVAIFAVVFAIAYFTAVGQDVTLIDGTQVGAATTKWVDAGLKMFYILIATALGAMVVSGIKKSISN